MSFGVPQLPDLALLKIFRWISLSERAKLKRVCKRWNFLIESMKQVCLCVYGTRFPEGEYLAYKRPEPDRRNAIRVCSVDAVPNLTGPPFRSVDYLYLLAIENWRFMTDLNHLTKLKELVICHQSFEWLNLKLPCLSVLCLKKASFTHLDLDAEQLTTFVFWGKFGDFAFCSVNFRHPETLKVLEYESYVFENALQEFCNLEHLTGVQQCHSPIDLRALPKLKTLDLVARTESTNGRGLNVEMSSMVQGMSQRPDVHISSLGLEDYLFVFAWYRCTFLDVDHNYLIRYDTRVNPISFPIMISSFGQIAKKFHERSYYDYYDSDDDSDDSEEISQIEIPKSFFIKVPHISSIYMSTSSDPRNLVDFLRKSRCPVLRVLNKGHQEFFNQISYLTSITTLIIRTSANVRSVPALNFDFLVNMISLVNLELRICPQKWPLDSILRAVKKCKFFAHLILHQDINHVEVFFQPYTREAYNCMVFKRKLPEQSVEELFQYLSENEETKPFCDYSQF